MPATDRLLFALLGMIADRGVDDVAVELRHARDDRQVLLLDRAGLELGGERVVGLVVLGDDDHAARVAVEPMDDARPRRPAALAHRAEMMGQRPGERAVPMPLGRVDDHPGRLVHDDDRIVLVQDVERDVLRHGPFARHFELEHRDDVALAQLQRRPAGGVVDANLAGLDRPLQRGPAEGRAAARRETRRAVGRTLRAEP